MGDSVEYTARQKAEADRQAKKVKTRGDCLSDAHFEVYNEIGRRRGGVVQKDIPGNKGTVSKAIQKLTEEPALIIKDEATGKWTKHPEADVRFSTPYHLQEL